jgi:hypothetical protein
LILGRKASGKTAIYRKLLREKSYSQFSFGHDFTDYPWQLHNHQAIVGVPDEQRFFQSWRYLILMTLSKILLNQDHSQSYCDEAMESLAKVERFVADTYGTLNPDVAQIFSPVRKLRFKSSFEITLPLKMTLNAEGVPMSELPSIVQEVKRNLIEAVVNGVNPPSRPQERRNVKKWRRSDERFKTCGPRPSKTPANSRVKPQNLRTPYQPTTYRWHLS